jgi:RNA polymerase sigma-70 factor, ECF subfamily
VADPPGTRCADRDNAAWLGALTCAGRDRDDALADLHARLLRFARSRVNARGSAFGVSGPEAEDLAHQAAADALVAIEAKLATFRGESRFTTWAYKFVMLEVSNKLGRHFWRDAAPPPDPAAWEALPDRFGLDPAHESEWRDLLVALRRAIDTELTEHQRRLFVAIVLNRIPLDAMVAQLDTNRNAIYKTLFDARRKLRACLVANGYLTAEGATRR